MADFQGLVILTLDRVILHTVMHHSSTSTYIPNVIEIEGSFLEIEPEQFLVLFRPGTTSVRSGLGTFFVPEPEYAKHFLCS